MLRQRFQHLILSVKGIGTLHSGYAKGGEAIVAKCFWKKASSLPTSPQPFHTHTTMSKPILSPNQEIHWMLDWDGTITKKDTLDALVHVAEEKKPSAMISKKWEEVVDAYLKDYQTMFKKLAPDGHLPTSFEEEKEMLHSLEEVEQRSLDRVYGYGVFQGLTLDDLERGAIEAITYRRVQIREGYNEFLQARTNPKRPLNIISVNWSARFIEACLKAANISSNIGAISSNEIGVDGCITASSPFQLSDVKALVSSRHKFQVFSLNRTACDIANGYSYPAVYIGDSWTDLECLLAAELGICIRDEPMTSAQQKLADSLRRLGVNCARLKGTKNTDSWSIVWASDFYEIAEWIKTYS